eukprot:355683-Alexandrium_andersonii.AAC.1
MFGWPDECGPEIVAVRSCSEGGTSQAVPARRGFAVPDHWRSHSAVRVAPILLDIPVACGSAQAPADG